MADLPETPGTEWPSLYRVENGDPQSGGLWDPATKAGLWNAHAEALIERTNNARGLALRAAPAGAVMAFAADNPPDGWLECDGALIARASYADLFAMIGEAFGAGDGATTFALPDLRGEFLRGWDHGRGIDAARAFGAAQGDAMRNLTGAIGEFTYQDLNVSANGVFEHDATFPSNRNRPSSMTQIAQNGDRITFDASRQVPVASEIRPRNIAMMFCVKF